MVHAQVRPNAQQLEDSLFLRGLGYWCAIDGTLEQRRECLRQERLPQRGLLLDYPQTALILVLHTTGMHSAERPTVFDSEVVCEGLGGGFDLVPLISLIEWQPGEEVAQLRRRERGVARRSVHGG